MTANGGRAGACAGGAYRDKGDASRGAHTGSLGRSAMAGPGAKRRQFATPWATPGGNISVVGEQRGHGHTETIGDADEPVDDAGVAGLLDAVDGLSVHAAEFAETVLREAASFTEDANAVTDARALAQNVGVALLGHHPTLVDPRSKVSTTCGTSRRKGVNTFKPDLAGQAPRWGGSALLPFLSMRISA